NVAEKINSQYKTWEFQLYTFRIAPALLHSILPQAYWQNFCKLVRGFQIMCQHHITQAKLRDAQALLCTWECEFETLYYQLKEDHIHFICPCVHQVSHLVTKAVQKGPPICYVQWTMECTIRNLGQELRQPSKPYANLSKEGVCRCKVNSLISIMPELGDPPKELPYGSINLGGGYVLLCKRAKHIAYPTSNAAQAILNFLGPGRQFLSFKKWARLLLPNRQVVHSAWREKLRSPEETQIKVNNQIRLGEVQHFGRLSVQECQEGEAEEFYNDEDANGNWVFTDIAVIQMYSMPDKEFLQQSCQVIPFSTLLDDTLVVGVKSTMGVMAMVPQRFTLPSGEDKEGFFMVEKPGLDISDLGVPYSVYDEFDNNDNGEDIE
ncbi:hypothetical protein BS17DRAFT_859121, partial [Gyrodon lividus]